ncbi:hypothetical protein GCM10010191_15420 [Actinomadura vinacea]|uniref:LapA family protein n=2 Tax=Actinomadura vinacea TaxID=115336 RepID=A0ABP5VR21_9ACTN
MWLNLIFLSVASLTVGFVLGWFVASPRRWTDRFEPAEQTDDLSSFTRRA